MNDRIDFAFLDSGTGGIPYMLNLKNKSPDCRCVYLGDTANFPYGQKTNKQITDCACGAIKTIVDRWNPETVVIACNTISVTALDELRRLFPDLPIVGTVPAIKLAAKVTVNKRIGLLATNATVKHPYNAKLIEDFASDCKVFSRGDPDLVSFIEHDYFTATKEQRLKAVKPAVDYFKANNCDVIILGCTHFTHIASEITEAAGKDVKVIDSRDGVCNQAIKVESEKTENFLKNQDKVSLLKELPPDMSFFVTGLKDINSEKEYATLCSSYKIPWGGLIK